MFQSTNTLTISGNEIIGDNGNGFSTLAGGTHTVNGTLIAGNLAGGTGLVTVTGGTLSVPIAEIDVGSSGSGTVQQSGGQGFRPPS